MEPIEPTWRIALSVLYGRYSQREIADMIGTAESTVGTWVRGQHTPHPRQRRKLIETAYERAPHDMRAARRERGTDD